MSTPDTFAPTNFHFPNGEPFIGLSEARRRAEREETEAAQRATEPATKALESWLAAGGTLSVVSTEAVVSIDRLNRLLKRELASDGWGPSYRWSPKEQSETAAKVGAWLLASAEGDKTHAAHADTPTTREICRHIDQARELKRLTVIIGGVGIGKSFAGRMMARSRPRTAGAPGILFVEQRESHRTIKQFLLHVWQGLACAPDQEPRGDLEGAVAGLLRKGDVVIIDECNRLSQCGAGRVTEVIRSLFDNAPASWVLMGNSETNKNGQILDEALYSAFLSRAHRCELDATTDADVAAFMAWKGLEGEQLSRQLVRLFAGARNSAPRRVGGTFRNVGLRGLNRALEDARLEAKELGISDSEALRRFLAPQLAHSQG